MNLYDFMTVINEATLKDLEDKQKDITKLFPEFYSRVEAVRLSGGIRMVGKDEKGWDFIVHSAKEDKWYPVRVNFDGVREVIAHHAKNKSLWTKDKGKINARSLAGEVMYNVDIKVKCGCPADLYWGSQYIRSQEPLDANFPPKEERPPVERNPKQHGSMCKHLQVVINLLPMYEGTFAKWLKEYFGADMTKTEQAARREGNELKDRAEEVQTEEEPKTEAERKAKEKTSESINEEMDKSMRLWGPVPGSTYSWIGYGENSDLLTDQKTGDLLVIVKYIRKRSGSVGYKLEAYGKYSQTVKPTYSEYSDKRFVEEEALKMVEKIREKVIESREPRKLLFQKEGENNV